jgi:NADH-quinone oxidoreductase subunit M
MVNHALMSSALFLLAGMVERRTSTGQFALLGGMARGRPALATVVMATGIISLAVPLSTSFAGEFLILAGIFQQHWAWAVIGASGIVLAAMYMLRAISAVLHQDVGPAVPESALDLRGGELAVVVPLVLCLIGLSAYPNLISGHAFGGNRAITQVITPGGGYRTPTIDRVAAGGSGTSLTMSSGQEPAQMTACTTSKSEGSCQTIYVIGDNCAPKPCTVVNHGDTTVVVAPNGAKATWTRYTP